MKPKKLPQWLIFLIPLIFLGVNMAFFFPKRVKSIYPDPNIADLINGFTDLTVGGDSLSTVTEIETGLSWHYKLGDLAPYPYAGVSIHTGYRGLQDISPYTHMRIRIQSEKADRVRLQLIFNLPDYSNPMDISTYRFYNQWIPVGPVMDTTRLPLNSFSTPVWWFKSNQLPLDSKPINGIMKKNLLNVEMLSDEVVDGGFSDRILLESLELVKDPLLYFLPSAALIFLYYCFLSVMLMRKRRKENKDLYHKPLDISKVKDEETRRLLDYLFEHYNDPELALRPVASQCGLSEKKASGLLKEQTDCSFRSYLNRLRLDEAKRQLLHSDRNVSEIAYMVGYNSSSQFTRVFKQFEECSPTDYRRNNKE